MLDVLMRIAVIGDIHQHLDARDIAWIDAQTFALVLITGDLPGRFHQGLEDVVQTLSTLRTRAVWIPGNHDAPSIAQLVLDQLPWRASAGQIGPRLERLKAAISPVEVGGYSVHEVSDDTALLVGRPLAMDGRRVTFAAAVSQHWGVESLEGSVERMKGLVDAHGFERWWVLGHNGPAGLGAGAQAPWGIRGRDLGDPDLSEIVAYLKQTGRQVPLVVAGHVHHRAGVRGRQWCVRSEETTYVNAARVPRHDQSGERHVVVLTLVGDQLEVEAVTYR